MYQLSCISVINEYCVLSYVHDISVRILIYVCSVYYLALHYTHILGFQNGRKCNELLIDIYEFI